MNARPILVLGIDRSGTSLLSDVLVRWGAYPGEAADLPPADQGNPGGYWEHNAMEDFVRDLNASIGVPLVDPEFKPRLRRQAEDPIWRRRALDLAAAMERPDRPWFWKEPNNSFLVPFWSRVLPDPVYLITLREPTNSGISFEKLMLPPILVGKLNLRCYFLLRWQLLMMTLAEELKNYPSKIIVPYEALIAAPQEQCGRVARFLAAEYGAAAPNGPGQLDRMAEAISPALWRNRSDVPFLEAPHVSAAQKKLFSYLASRLDGDFLDFDPGLYPFPEFWQEYFINVEVINWLMKSL